MAQILAVDDSAFIREFISSTLIAAGHEVELAVDGQDGFSKATARQYDVVLTDLNMPEVDGVSLLEQLRQQPEYEFTPVVMISSEINSQRFEAAQECFVTGWLAKPFDEAKLLKAVNRAID